jgi:hypothetical protein
MVKRMGMVGAGVIQSLQKNRKGSFVLLSPLEKPHLSVYL